MSEHRAIEFLRKLLATANGSYEETLVRGEARSYLAELDLRCPGGSTDADPFKLERLLRDFAPIIADCKRNTGRSDEHDYLDELEARRQAALGAFSAVGPAVSGEQAPPKEVIPREAALEFAADFRRRAGLNEVSLVAPALACDLARLLESAAALGRPHERNVSAEFTLCRETGRLAADGACPAHLGDACLRQYAPVDGIGLPQAPKEGDPLLERDRIWCRAMVELMNAGTITPVDVEAITRRFNELRPDPSGAALESEPDQCWCSGFLHDPDCPEKPK